MKPTPFCFRRLFTGCSLVLAFLSLPLQAEEAVNFEDHIQPIFRDHCFSCHNADKAKAGVDLTRYAAVLGGGSSGDTVVAGDPDSSSLYLVMTHAQEPKMPQRASKRPDSELALLRRWIEGGLLDSSGGTAKKASKPKVSLALAEAPGERPEGPPPMPEDLPLEPVVHTGKANAVVALAASPWAPLTAVGGQRQVLLYNTDTRQLAGVLPFPEGMPHIVGFSRSGTLVFAGGGVGARSGRVVIWEVQTGDRVAVVGEEYDAVMAADLSPDQTRVGMGGTDRLVKIYDTASGEQLQKIKKHTDWVTAVAFSPDGILLATADRNGGLFIWEAESGQEFYNLPGHKEAVTALSWRRDANLLASAGEDGTIKLWDMHSGKQVKSWNAHGDGVLHVAYAPNGNLVSGGRDKTCKTWDGNGKNLKTIKGYDDLVLSTVFLHDSRHIVSGDWQGRVRILDAESAEELAQLSPDPEPIASHLARAEKRAGEREGPCRTAEEASTKASGAYQALRLTQRRRDLEAETATGIERIAHRERDRMQQQVASLQPGLAQAREARDKTAAARTAEDQSLATLREEHEPLGPQVTAIETRLAEQREFARARDEAVAVALTAAQLKPEDTALKEAAGMAASEAASARDALHQLEQDLSAAKTRIENLDRQMADHRQKRTAQETAFKQAETNMQQAEQALHAAREALATMKQVHEASATTGQTATELAARDRGLLEAAQKTTEDTLAQATAARQAYDTARREAAFWKAAQFNLEVRTARDEMRQARELFDSQRAEADQLSREIDAVLETLNQLRREESGRRKAANPGELAQGSAAYTTGIQAHLERLQKQSAAEATTREAVDQTGADLAIKTGRHDELRRKFEELKAAL